MKIVVLSLCLLASFIGAAAQTPVAVAVPAQFASAQTAFLGAAAAPVIVGKDKLATAMIYDSMYRALSVSNQYHLLATPAAAELSMEVSLVSTGTAGVESAVLRLSVRDSKTQALLWNIDEAVEGAFREKTFQKNVDDAASRIVADLKALAAGKNPQ